MKKLLLFSVSVLIAFITYATVHTVSNDPAKPAQFTSPTTAMAAAASGDTLYIYGSPNSYGDLAINKSITLIGPGYNARKERFYQAYFFRIELASASLTNVTLNGIAADQFGRLAVSPNTSMSNFTIRNCHINNFGLGSSISCGLTVSNWLVENCFILVYQPGLNNACNPLSPVTSSFLTKNCLIGQAISATPYNHQFVNCQLGLQDLGGNFGSARNCTFTNCIFLRCTFNQTSAVIGNNFINCLTYQTQFPSANFDLNSWTGGASGSATNCIINQNPLWVTTPIHNPTFIIGANQLDKRAEWNPVMQAGSPAINSGSDGTNIGLTGGLVPYNVSAEPKIPVVRRFSLVNPVVPSNGTLTANATATKAQ